MRDRKFKFDRKEGCYKFDMMRTKGNKSGKSVCKLVFTSRSHWASYAFHSLSSHFIVNDGGSGDDDYTFAGVPHTGKIASFINDVLKVFHDKLDLYLMSHSNRHGAASVANIHPDISLTWIIERGDWVMDSVSTAFEYILGSSKADRSVARVL